jgi:hypothetical protein
MTDTDPNSNFEETNEYPIDDEPVPIDRKRHGCVTAWLVFMLIANSIISLIYLFTLVRTDQVLKISASSLTALIIVGLLNVAFAIMVLLWKKVGFYGFAITSAVAFIINISLGISLIKCTVGLIGFLILYGILQIKQDGVSAWENLE